MLSEKELKIKLQTLSKEKFKTKDNRIPSQLVSSMMVHIGTPDGEFRDDLIYGAFVTWVMRHNAIPNDLLQEIFQTLLDENHLLYKIGEKNTDSVFQRAFSVLWLPPILIKHREKPFLSPSDFQDAYEKLIRFFREEKDRRGFVDGKGWAHAIAHAADALDDLAQCPAINKEQHKDMLTVIQETICVTEIVYSHGEEERLVTPVLAILKSGLLSNDEIIQWVKSFSEKVAAAKEMPEGVMLRSNIKNFLQSFYFRLQWAEFEKDLLPIIRETLAEISFYA